MPTKAQLLDLKMVKDLIYSQISLTENQILSLYSNVKSEKTIEAEGIKNTNNLINAVENYDENDKIIHDIYLSTVARDDYNFTATQAMQL